MAPMPTPQSRSYAYASELRNYWTDSKNYSGPEKTVEGTQILMTSGSSVTSQVKSKSKCSTFRVCDIGEQNFDVKLK